MRAYVVGDKLSSRSFDFDTTMSKNPKILIPHSDIRSMLSKSQSIDYDHGEIEMHDLLSAHVAVLVIGEDLISGTVLMIAPDLVMTALHAVDGWDVPTMCIRFQSAAEDEQPKLVQVTCAVEMNSLRDYCILLQLTDTIPDRMQPCKFTGKLPTYAFLAHYPHGFRLHITGGEVVRESFGLTTSFRSRDCWGCHLLEDISMLMVSCLHFT